MFYDAINSCRAYMSLLIWFPFHLFPHTNAYAYQSLMQYNYHAVIGSFCTFLYCSLFTCSRKYTVFMQFISFSMIPVLITSYLNPHIAHMYTCLFTHYRFPSYCIHSSYSMHNIGKTNTSHTIAQFRMLYICLVIHALYCIYDPL